MFYFICAFWAKEPNLADISFDIVNPVVVANSTDLLLGSYRVGVAAFTAELQSADKACAFMGKPGAFMDDHRYPQRMVDAGKLNPQDITRPYLVVATDNKRPLQERVVGFAYGYDSVTGDTADERRIKAATLFKRWRALEKIAVDPNYQGRGIAQVLGYLTFVQAFPLQPAGAYTHPGEGQAGVRLLTKWGLHDDGGQQLVHPYGPEGREVTQHRHSNRSARGIARNIKRQNGNGQLFHDLKRRYGIIGRQLHSNNDEANLAVHRDPTGK